MMEAHRHDVYRSTTERVAWIADASYEQRRFGLDVVTVQLGIHAEHWMRLRRRFGSRGATPAEALNLALEHFLQCDNGLYSDLDDYVFEVPTGLNLTEDALELLNDLVALWNETEGPDEPQIGARQMLRVMLADGYDVRLQDLEARRSKQTPLTSTSEPTGELARNTTEGTNR